MTRRAMNRVSKFVMLGLALALAGPIGAKETELPKAADMLRWRGDAQVAGFRNIDRIFPVRIVKRGPKVRPLPRADQQIAPSLNYDGSPVSIDEYVARERIAGLLVISHGKVVLEKYGLGQKPEDKWISFSVAKSVTSTLLGAAIRDGKIKSVDDLVTTYIPELKGGAYDGVTLRQVLAMRSGAQWNEDYTDASSDVGQLAASMAENKGASLIAMMATRPRAAEPGSRFLYSTGESNMVGIIVSRAVGEPLADYLSRKIWAPYGMESDASWLTDGGTEIGGCCLNVTLRDYGRLGLFMMEGGSAGGAGVVPAGWIGEATTNKSSPGETPYGYQWWIPSPGTYAALGIFGQTIYIDPAKDLVIVQIAAWPAASGPQYSARRLALVGAVNESLALAKP
jgi:CubicO group peptidase (beta-lactamase class C family)